MAEKQGLTRQDSKIIIQLLLRKGNRRQSKFERKRGMRYEQRKNECNDGKSEYVL